MNWLKAQGKAVTQGERKYLKATAEKFPKGLIVNIGVFRCATMYCLRAGAPDARMIGVDIKPCDVKIAPVLKAKFIIGDSRKCHVQVTDPVDLMFIDGDHHYEVVKADIKNWTPKIRKGGVVIFHDCYPLPKDILANKHLVGVNKAVSEWFDPEAWEELQAIDSLRAFKKL